MQLDRTFSVQKNQVDRGQTKLIRRYLPGPRPKVVIAFAGGGRIRMVEITVKSLMYSHCVEDLDEGGKIDPRSMVFPNEDAECLSPNVLAARSMRATESSGIW